MKATDGVHPRRLPVRAGGLFGTGPARRVRRLSKKGRPEGPDQEEWTGCPGQHVLGNLPEGRLGPGSLSVGREHHEVHLILGRKAVDLIGGGAVRKVRMHRHIHVPSLLRTSLLQKRSELAPATVLRQWRGAEREPTCAGEGNVWERLDDVQHVDRRVAQARQRTGAPETGRAGARGAQGRRNR